MLFVNKKYESLERILYNNNNEAYDIGADFDEQDVLDAFKSINKKLSETDLDSLTQFVNYLYNAWDKSFNKDPRLIPFRFDNSKNVVDIARPYKEILNNEYNLKEDKFKFGGIQFKYGEGSLFKNRAEKGLEYENSIIGELKQLIEVTANNSKKRLLTEDKVKSLIDDPSVYHLIPIYTSGALNNAIKEYRNGTSLDQLVIGTGKVDPRRNKNHELWSDDFDITDNNMEKVLIESGKIISDVTVTSSPEVYASVKIETAQLSGVFCSNIFKNNKSLIEGAKNNIPYNKVKNSADMRAFKNFCNAIGADQEDLYNKYKSLYNGEKITDAVKLADNYDSSLLGIVFQKLVGGNYWYVKPSTSVFVPPKDLNLKFIRSKIRITSSGKKIVAYGTINGEIEARVELRTAGEGNLPYRLFPVVSVPELLKSIT